MPLEELLKDFDDRRQRALAKGGPQKLAERRAQGVLNARERVDRLFDARTFLECGLLIRRAHARRNGRRLDRIRGRPCQIPAPARIAVGCGPTSD